MEDLIKILEKNFKDTGRTVSIGNGHVTIRDENNNKLCFVGNKNMVTTGYNHFEKLSFAEQIEFYKILSNSLEECHNLRTTKYYWKPKLIENSKYVGRDLYFNYRNINSWFLHAPFSVVGIETQFTIDEFKQICKKLELDITQFIKEEI